MPNTDNINKTIEVIKEHKELLFNMCGYMNDSFNEEKNVCETSCCLAGYATIAAYGTVDKIPDQEDGFVDYFSIGQDYLGIDDNTAERLFLPDGQSFFNTDKDDAILALETLRDTGEVLWDSRPLYPEEE